MLKVNIFILKERLLNDFLRVLKLGFYKIKIKFFYFYKKINTQYIIKPESSYIQYT